MALKYKVSGRQKLDGSQLYIEVHKITELLKFEDYLNEIVDNVEPHSYVHPLFKNTIHVFHPVRDYTEVEKNFNTIRIETGELRLVDKKYSIKIGDYIRYDPMIDEIAPWDVEGAKQRANLVLVES